MKYLLILLLAACSSDPSPPKDPPPTNKGHLSHNVVAFGDSLTARQGYIQMAAGHFGWNLDDRAVGGTTSDQQIVVIENTELSQYDTIVYMAGFNDARLYGANSSVFESNFSQAMALFGKTNARIYIGTTMRMLPAEYTNPKDGAFVKGSDTVMLQYSNVIKRLALMYPNAIIFDVNAKFEPLPEYIQDTVHPTPEGDVVINAIFEEVVQ